MCSGPLQTSTIETFPTLVNSVNRKTLTIFAKSSISRAWLDPKCTSADEYNAGLKIRTDMSPWQQIKINPLQLKFRSVNCLSINESLKQLSKVSTRSRSQGYWFWNIFVIMKVSVMDFIFSKFQVFIIFFWPSLDRWLWSMKIILWDISYFRHYNNIKVAVCNYKSLIAKTFYENTLEMNAASSI